MAELAFPGEACGLLGGARERDEVRLYCVPVPNAATSPNTFRITAPHLLSAGAALRRRRLLLYGCFHTHPTIGPEPSWFDRASMARFPLWWLIYSPRAHRLRVLRARGGRIESARVHVG